MSTHPSSCGDKAMDGALLHDDEHVTAGTSFSNIPSPSKPPSVEVIKRAEDGFRKMMQMSPGDFYVPSVKIIPPWMYDELQRLKVDDPDLYRECMANLRGST